MCEVWKDISVNSNYEISVLGNVRNKSTGKILKPNTTVMGYLSICLSKNNISIKYALHRLVALTFLPNFYNKDTVNHKNKIKNDNRLWNLEWASIKEQNIHKNLNKEKNTFYMCTMRPIWRIDIKTNIKLEKYNNLTEAQDWCIKNNLSKSIYLKNSISQAALGIRKTGLGYKWEYENIVIEEIENEIWKEIPTNLINGYNNIQLSSFGRIKYTDGSIGNGYNYSGYLGISIGGKTYRLHRLVAQVFLQNPDNKYVVNHKDGNKLNSKLSNLEWNTSKENSTHAYNTGLNKNTRQVVQFDLDMNKIKEFISINDASRELHISSCRISKCCKKKLTNIENFIFLFKEEYVDKITNNNNNIILKNKNKIIIQFDLNFNIIKYFGSIFKASNELNIHKSLIYDCCEKKQKTTNGFIFMYKHEYNPNIEYKLIKNTKAKKVIQLDFDMNKIKIFNSIINASEELKINDSLISSCCKGKRNSTGGFKFMYLNDYNDINQSQKKPIKI